MSSDVEAKIVVLGAQGVGKTSLVHRYVTNAFTPPDPTSTIGASFVTKRVVDADTSTTVRLQIWDTAGQERFRSISKLYYRGANAAIICYDVTNEASFKEIDYFLNELRSTTDGQNDVIIHVVGTKSDIVAGDPRARAVPLDRCIAYINQHLLPVQPAATLHVPYGASATAAMPHMGSPASNRSSGFWAADNIGWDCVHEISARDGEGIDEVFRVITRKLVEQRNARLAQLQAHEQANLAGGASSYGSRATPGGMGEGVDYFHGAHPGASHLSRPGMGGAAASGSFRVGHGDKRRSWLGLPTTPGGLSSYANTASDLDDEIARMRGKRGGRCC